MANIFEGIKVIDFSSNLAGPTCTQMLADFGAEVIKIERPGVGDDTRAIVPRIEGQSLFFCWANRGKKSVTMELKDPKSQELLRQMIADADVVLESFKPGQMKKFGLDYDSVAKINSRIVYCSVSVAGQTGPYSNLPGYDLVAQAMSGVMDMTGDPSGEPVKCGVTIGDYVGASNAFSAISAALFHRERTGEGQSIDIALLDGMIAVNTGIDQAATLQLKPTRTGAHHATLCPYGIFKGKNSQSIVLVAFNNNMWAKLCHLMQHPEMIDSPSFHTSVARVSNSAQVIATVEDWLATYENIDDAVAELKTVGVSACKICDTAEVVADKAYWDRGAIIDIELPPSFQTMRTMQGRGNCLKFSKTPAVPGRAPDLGEHNHEVLERYGLSAEEVDALLDNWAKK